MPAFHHRRGVLHADDVPLTRIAAEAGTPCYVTSAAALRQAARAFRDCLAAVPDKRLAFAVKANPDLAVLRILADEGYGADIVSGGELAHALAAGMPAPSIVFSGVGKTDAEKTAAIDAGIGQFNLELEEGRVLGALAAARGKTVRAVLRVNPDVDAGTHAKITTETAVGKFGVAIADAFAIYARLAGVPRLELSGVAVHIGSQIADVGRLERACCRIGLLVAALREAGHNVGHLDLGGGLAVPYRADDPRPALAEYGAMVARVTRDWKVELTFEPGRVIAAGASVLLTRVVWMKPGDPHPHVIVDAGMNDLARPAMYGAWHESAAVSPDGRRMVANVAGPVCESGDTFAEGRSIDRVARGDLAVFRDVGAYGASMASTYNSRELVAEVLVDGDRFAATAEGGSTGRALARRGVPEWLEGEDMVPLAA